MNKGSGGAGGNANTMKLLLPYFGPLCFKKVCLFKSVTFSLTGNELQYKLVIFR